MKRAAVLVVVVIAIAGFATWQTLRPGRRIPSREADKPPVAATPPDRYPEHPDVALEAGVADDAPNAIVGPVLQVGGLRVGIGDAPAGAEYLADVCLAVAVSATTQAAVTAAPTGPVAAGQGPWLSWPFAPDNHYTVQFKNNLADPFWQPLPGNITNLGVKAWLQDAAPASPQRIYRVISY